MEVSPRLPGLLPTLEKHPQADDTRKRPRIEECLHRDALEAIMGHLDRETLCTSRLVSKTFCAAASAQVCSLTVASTSTAVSFHSYPHVQHVTVRHVYADHSYPHSLSREDSLAQLDARLRNLVTALTIGPEHYSAPIAQTRDHLSQAALMPKLRKLELKGDVEHEAALLACCTNLEALALRDCSISVARTFVTMTRLTLLDVGRVLKDGDQAPFAWDNSWLGPATNLRSLQALSIHTFYAALPLIGNLTGLTGLTVCASAEDATCSVAPLTRLTRLRSLFFHGDLTESNLGIACSLGSGSLVNLGLRACKEASADCGRFLSRQTALTQLSLYGRQLCNLRHMGALRIELLQCLGLNSLAVLDAEGLSVLCRATRLTKLYILARMTEPQMGLSQVLVQLTQLRSLWWYGCDAPDILDFPLAVSPLTGLTKLNIASPYLDDDDLRALLVLTGLRNLELVFCSLTDAVVPDLAVLTNLNTLKLWCCGATSLARVSEVLDPLRKVRGLPCLQAVTTNLLRGKVMADSCGADIWRSQVCTLALELEMLV